jgi:hypothetical protein
MEIALRTALLGWLAGDATLAAILNAIAEEAPQRAPSLPWLGIATSSSTDWSTKTETGLETRLTLALHARGDQPDVCAALASAVQARIVSLPRTQTGWRIISAALLRSAVKQMPENGRQVELEYRFRLIAA